MVGDREPDLCVAVDERARLVDASIRDQDLARDDERLGAGSAVAQTALDE